MTREELLQLIDKAADEGQTELDLAGLGLEELLLLKRCRGEAFGHKTWDFPDKLSPKCFIPTSLPHQPKNPVTIK